jgi:hypothetical protein
MLSIQKNKAWAFWPSGVCLTYGETFANQYIRPQYNFDIYLEFTMKGKVEEYASIFAILPKYICINWWSNEYALLDFNHNGQQLVEIGGHIVTGKRTHLVISNRVNEHFSIYINKEEVFKTDTFGDFEDPHMILGAPGFPSDHDNPTFAEYDLHQFMFYKDDKLISHHRFDRFIHHKSYDLTGNLNFIHQLGNKKEYEENGSTF